MAEDRNEKLFDVPDEMEDMVDEEAFTKAISRLSDTDRHLFEDTGVIHVDRNMPAETQTMHVVSLTRKHRQKRNTVFTIILCLLCAGIVIGSIGIGLKISLGRSDAKQEENVKLSSVKIDEASFPDSVFRSHISSRYDSDHDGILSGEELTSVLVMIVPSDPGITSIKGIEQFVNLQSLTLSGTSVTEVDLTANTELTYLDISDTPLTSITLQRQEKLMDIRADNTASLTEVFMPAISSITVFETEGSGVECSKNEEGYYEGCMVKPAVSENE